MENSISAFQNYSDLRNRFYNQAKEKLNNLLNSVQPGNAEIKDQIPSCDGDTEPKNLKIALHVGPKRTDIGNVLDPNSRIVTLRSLTNPSVAVTFNAISPEKSNFSPNDKLFTALDFIFKLVPQEFNSIKTHSERQEGDINISLGDHEDVTSYQYTKNESGKLESTRASIEGLSISKAPQKATA